MANKVTQILPKEKDTKNFQKFSIEDEDKSLPITSLYVRNGSLPELEPGQKVKVTVEVVS